MSAPQFACVSAVAPSVEAARPAIPACSSGSAPSESCSFWMRRTSFLA